MDQIWIIIGWAVTILMIVLALRLLLAKPQPPQPAEQTELMIDPQSQQPIVPRHLRPNQDSNTVLVDSVAESNATLAQAEVETAQNQVVEPEEKTSQNEKVDENQLKQELDDVLVQLQDEKELVAEAKQLNITENTSSEQLDASEQEQDKVAVNAIVTTEWESEASVLDAHLSEQNRQDEESALATAQQLLALYMYPNPERALSGERTLKMLLRYGLRYGEMSCFHRYEDTDKPSPLMFSVLRINNDGAPTGFDLETLPSEEVKGLAFFLALPNAHAIQGFDMMVSLAGLMARDTDGMVFDEQSLELTPQLRDHWRHFVIEYKPNQALI